MSLKSLFINHTEGQKETCCTRGSSNYSRGRGGSSPSITSFYAPWGHDAAASSWGTNYCVESSAAFAFTDRRFWGFVPRHLPPLPLLCSACFVSSWSEVWLGSELESALWFLNSLHEWRRQGKQGRRTGQTQRETEVNKCECKWRKPEPILGHKLFDVYSKRGCDLCVRVGEGARKGRQ